MVPPWDLDDLNFSVTTYVSHESHHYNNIFVKIKYFPHHIF